MNFATCVDPFCHFKVCRIKIMLVEKLECNGMVPKEYPIV